MFYSIIKHFEMEKNVIQGKYKLQSILGKGQFGTVCKATYKDKSVAVKLETQYSFVNTLCHEATILRYLHNKKVQYIPEIMYYGVETPYYCLVMSYYDEGSLEDYELEIDHVHVWWLQACQVLSHVHDHGIVHRDIKPAHFMKTTNGEETRWVLIDFGMATPYIDEESKHIHENKEPKENGIGSVNWMSYYIHKGMEYTRRDDYITIVYIFLDLCLQTVNKNLPWLDKYKGFQNLKDEINNNIIKDKSWDNLKINIIDSDLNKEEKRLLEKIIFLCDRLKFSDKPPYEYVWFEF